MNYPDDEQGTLDPKRLYSQDSENKEIDTKEVIEELYHGWLGEKEVGEHWVRDPTLKRLMNEQGASLLISEIKARFNTHTHFTVLDSEDIKLMVSEAAINIVKILKYDYWKYGMEAKHIVDICTQVKDALYIFLNIPLLGGFRQYKENKTKTVINKISGNSSEE